jgi:ABC-type tungstate transport system permease subunit
MSGIGAALNAAQAMKAYTISDRGSWLSFANEGDPEDLREIVGAYHRCVTDTVGLCGGLT